MKIIKGFVFVCFFFIIAFTISHDFVRVQILSMLITAITFLKGENDRTKLEVFLCILGGLITWWCTKDLVFAFATYVCSLLCKFIHNHYIDRV